MNTKLLALSDAGERHLSLFMTAGQVNDQIGVAVLLDAPLNPQWLLGNRDLMSTDSCMPPSPSRSQRDCK